MPEATRAGSSIGQDFVFSLYWQTKSVGQFQHDRCC